MWDQSRSQWDASSASPAIRALCTQCTTASIKRMWSESVGPSRCVLLSVEWAHHFSFIIKWGHRNFYLFLNTKKVKRWDWRRMNDYMSRDVFNYQKITLVGKYMSCCWDCGSVVVPAICDLGMWYNGVKKHIPWLSSILGKKTLNCVWSVALLCHPGWETQHLELQH